MTRTWSIRARTALAFALASMAITAAVLVFVNVASQQSFSQALSAEGPGPSIAPDPDQDAPPGTSVALVQQVSVLQWQWSAVGIVAAGALAGGLGWSVSRRMLRPVDRISATATRISASNLHERIALDGPDDELRRLATTIDALLGRLEAAFDSQRRFVAQASHELRTPLAVQRTALQVGLPDDASPSEIARTREQLLEHNRLTEHLVESLLVLAEADRGLDDQRVPIDLAALAAEAVAGIADRARTADVTLTCATGTAPPGRTGGGVTGEPTLVRQVVVNLVDNAVEYNEPGGSVRVVVDAQGLRVENTGPVVVPAAAVPSLVEPFRRHGDGGTRRHSGLGLSIVAAVVRAHGWRLDVRPRPGGGLVVRVGVSPVQPGADA